MTKIFFLDILNRILKVDNDEISIIYEKNNKIWFGFRDILKVLKYVNYKKAIKNLKIQDKFMQKYSNLQGAPVGAPLTIHPEKLFINESGLYELLSISKKPLAKIFMDKYFTEIMPLIRQNGEYIMNSHDNKLRIEINNKIEENKQLLNNQRNIVYPEGNAIYIIKQVVNNKKYYKIGYTKNLNKRLKVYNTGNANKILFNYFILVKDNDIDACIKKIMKNEEFIRNKEYYKSTMTQILKFITKCDANLNNICCGYCLKCYNFTKIKLHKCKFL